MINPSMNIAVGASAPAIVLDPAAIVRNILDIVRVAKNEAKRKKKKGPGERRRLAIKPTIPLARV